MTYSQKAKKLRDQTYTDCQKTFKLSLLWNFYELKVPGLDLKDIRLFCSKLNKKKTDNIH